MLKKLAVAVAAIVVSAPAFADRDHRDRGNGHKAKHYVVHQHYHQPRPVVHHYYYRPAPAQRVVYYPPQPVYHQPQPVYYHPHPNAGAALVVGAVLGAAIAHHVVASSY
ncbi:MAG: YppG family protein [Pseudomonadota bacterium]|nr:YppG family protein [Pseudomonadota bacterium]